LGGAYREFQAAMISGIAILLEPASEENEGRMRVLDAFIQDYAPVVGTDPTSAREMAIIQLLRKRASGMEDDEADSDIPRSNVSDTKDDVDLLLGLHHNTTVAIQPPESMVRLSQSYIPAAQGQVVGSPQDVSHLNGHSPILQQTTASTPSQPMDSLSSPWTNIQVNGSVFTLPVTPVHQNSGDSSSQASSSPSSDEAAQALLDNWCNVANASEGILEADAASWAGADFAALGGNISGYGMGEQPFIGGLMAGTGLNVNGLGESDWSYWDNLVDQIRQSGTGPN